ncbi:phosphotransacetylase family protein [Chlamydiota bacterium]
MKKVYIAATRQNDGKTIVSLGLLQAFGSIYQKIGYMKPVGQQYKLVDNKKIDKDAVLMNNIFNFNDDLKSMSPIAIPRGFTEDFILRGSTETIARTITHAYDTVSQNKDFLLIEGTGHAGVGSVFNMSNSDVAKLLRTKVIIVSLGGVGRPIDEIMLNKAKFDQDGIEVLGVIINKVLPEKYEKINKLVRKSLSKKGIKVLGVIPHNDVLSNPTVAELFEDITGEIISDNTGFDNIVSNFVIGDMPHNAMDYFNNNTLLIIPGSREKLILAALSEYILEKKKTPKLSAIIFTCNACPHESIMKLLAKTGIPLIAVKEDSFSIASKINHMIFKLRSEDTKKIAKVKTLIKKYVAIDDIAELLTSNN